MEQPFLPKLSTEEQGNSYHSSGARLMDRHPYNRKLFETSQICFECIKADKLKSRGRLFCRMAIFKDYTYLLKHHQVTINSRP